MPHLQEFAGGLSAIVCADDMDLLKVGLACLEAADAGARVVVLGDGAKPDAEMEAKAAWCREHFQKPRTGWRAWPRREAAHAAP